MATKTFYSFATNSENVYTASEFKLLTERSTGFIASTVANSRTVNTVLLETSKFIEGLVDVFIDYTSEYTGNIGVDTSISNITSYFNLGLSNYINNNVDFTVLQSLNPVSGVDLIRFNVGKTTHDINNIHAYSAVDASNVTKSINGKDVASIFETNGTTVKNSTNVTASINGHSITSIFESNGTTAKTSTNAVNATNTDFTNSTWSSIDISSTSTSVSLVNNATYEMYVQYISSTSTSEPYICNYNFGIFTKLNSAPIQTVSVTFMNTSGTDKLIGLGITASDQIQLWEIDNTFAKKRLTSHNVSSAVSVTYTLYYRRIR